MAALDQLGRGGRHRLHVPLAGQRVEQTRLFDGRQRQPLVERRQRRLGAQLVAPHQLQAALHVQVAPVRVGTAHAFQVEQHQVRVPAGPAERQRQAQLRARRIGGVQPPVRRQRRLEAAALRQRQSHHLRRPFVSIIYRFFPLFVSLFTKPDSVSMVSRVLVVATGLVGGSRGFFFISHVALISKYFALIIPIPITDGLFRMSLKEKSAYGFKNMRISTLRSPTSGFYRVFTEFSWLLQGWLEGAEGFSSFRMLLH